jgi:hypothetical protein
MGAMQTTNLGIRGAREKVRGRETVEKTGKRGGSKTRTS